MISLSNVVHAHNMIIPCFLDRSFIFEEWCRFITFNPTWWTHRQHRYLGIPSSRSFFFDADTIINRGIALLSSCGRGRVAHWRPGKASLTIVGLIKFISFAACSQTTPVCRHFPVINVHHNYQACFVGNTNHERVKSLQSRQGCNDSPNHPNVDAFNHKPEIFHHSIYFWYDREIYQFHQA